jgi:hypothetical protein
MRPRPYTDMDTRTFEIECAIIAYKIVRHKSVA